MKDSDSGIAGARTVLYEWFLSISNGQSVSQIEFQLVRSTFTVWCRLTHTATAPLAVIMFIRTVLYEWFLSISNGQNGQSVCDVVITKYCAEAPEPCAVVCSSVQ